MKAYELLEPEGAWLQGGMSRDKNGGIVSPVHPKAAKWCTVGALHRCYPTWAEWTGHINTIQDLLGVRSVGDWNDAPDRTQAEVVALLKELDI